MTTASLHPLLAEALEAHGGLERWRSHKGLSSTIRTGGELWALRGSPIIAVPRRATSEFHRQWTHVSPFGEPEWELHWEGDRVAIKERDGTIIAQRDNGRDAFDRREEGQWDPLNLGYFNGYAMWIYHAAPFVLADPGYEIRDIAPVAVGNELLRGIAVRFPEHVHSHSREQQFFFGADGLLRRHDYLVEVWADQAAAHFLSDYVDVDGLKYPSRRRVYLRNPDRSPRRDMTLVSIDLSEYALF